MSTDTTLSGDLITDSDAQAVLATLNKSEIDQQIATAKAYPRSIKAFKEQAKELACLDEQTAGSCFYSVPRGKGEGRTYIEGASVRLAEIVGSAFGNLRYGARVVSTDERHVTAQGVCFDLEKNVSASIDVRRKITDKHGRRFSDDMITVTGNAACSIALRNAVFKVVPFALVKPIYDQAKLTSLGKAESFEKKRANCLEWFRKAGSTNEQVLRAIDRAGVDDITIDDLITLHGLTNAIKDGDITLDEALSVEADSPKSRKRARKADLKGQSETLADQVQTQLDNAESPEDIENIKRNAKQLAESDEDKAAIGELFDNQPNAAEEM